MLRVGPKYGASISVHLCSLSVPTMVQMLVTILISPQLISPSLFFAQKLGAQWNERRGHFHELGPSATNLSPDWLSKLGEGKWHHFPQDMGAGRNKGKKGEGVDHIQVAEWLVRPRAALCPWVTIAKFSAGFGYWTDGQPEQREAAGLQPSAALSNWCLRVDPRQPGVSWHRHRAMFVEQQTQDCEA